MVGSDPERTLPSANVVSGPTSWSPDGGTLYVDDRGNGSLDVWAVDVSGQSRPRHVLRSRGADAGARVSPDGRWLLYFSEESGGQHVYVQPVGAERPRWQVSTDRGAQPRWSRDGRRIYYVRSAAANQPSAAALERSRILAVDVTEAAGALHFGSPRVAYEGSPLLSAPERPVYDVHPDGRLLVIRREPQDLPTDTSHVVVAIDWASTLRLPEATRP